MVSTKSLAQETKGLNQPSKDKFHDVSHFNIDIEKSVKVLKERNYMFEVLVLKGKRWGMIFSPRANWFYLSFH